MKSSVNKFKKLPAKQQVKLTMLGVAAVGLLIVLVFHMQKLYRYEKLAKNTNQACVGIGIALRNGIDIKHYDFDARSIEDTWQPGATGQHKCATGTVITREQQNADGSGFSEGYQLGADVMYFRNHDAAYDFAEERENPMRYWGIDEEGQRNGIPQTSLFTFLETEVDEPYFDSYTVRGQAVVRLTLPCNMNEQNSIDQNFSNCQDLAEKTLKEFAETVERNLAANPIF